MSKWPDKYPSNCRLQHAGWIGYVHTDWPDDERCPVCRLMDEAEHLRAALAAAESKLSDCRASVKVCDVCGEETSTWEGHALKAALADEKASRIGWAESAERWRNHYYETLALLADERRHADAMAHGYQNNLSGRCAVCDVKVDEHHDYCPVFAHAARRAHDSECESEFDSQVHAHTPCGCAARRAAEVDRG